MKTRILHFFLIGGMLMMTQLLSAQLLTIASQKSSIVINGSSNLHDWKSTTSEIKGHLVLDDNSQPSALSVEIPVKSIKSGEKLMDSKTYETLKADKNPIIRFKMTEVSGFQKNGNDINMVVSGNLSIGGTTKKVSLKVAGKSNGVGTYNFNGNIALKMSEFGMKPPTALLGTLKVGDQVKLVFDVTLTDNQKASVN